MMVLVKPLANVTASIQSPSVSLPRPLPTERCSLALPRKRQITLFASACHTPSPCYRCSYIIGRVFGEIAPATLPIRYHQTNCAENSDYRHSLSGGIKRWRARLLLLLMVKKPDGTLETGNSLLLERRTLCSGLVLLLQLQETFKETPTPEPALDETPDQCSRSNEQIVQGMESSKTEKGPQWRHGNHHQIGHE